MVEGRDVLLVRPCLLHARAIIYASEEVYSNIPLEDQGIECDNLAKEVVE